jgi:hypothetical protein
MWHTWMLQVATNRSSILHRQLCRCCVHADVMLHLQRAYNLVQAMCVEHVVSTPSNLHLAHYYVAPVTVNHHVLMFRSFLASMPRNASACFLAAQHVCNSRLRGATAVLDIGLLKPYQEPAMPLSISSWGKCQDTEPRPGNARWQSSTITLRQQIFILRQ